jgi:hypothetical protein
MNRNGVDLFRPPDEWREVSCARAQANIGQRRQLEIKFPRLDA